jgi:quinol monooxygenase YgiN
MIMVQSTFQLLSEGKSTVIDLMRNMVQLSIAEPGCISYEYFEGITETNQVVLLQEWENAESLQDHYQTEHMDDFLAELGQYLESPVVTRSYVSPEERAVAAKMTEDEAKPEQTIH